MSEVLVDFLYIIYTTEVWQHKIAALHRRINSMKQIVLKAYSSLRSGQETCWSTKITYVKTEIL
jgi:hypothetical protein